MLVSLHLHNQHLTNLHYIFQMPICETLAVHCIHKIVIH